MYRPGAAGNSVAAQASFVMRPANRHTPSTTRPNLTFQAKEPGIVASHESSAPANPRTPSLPFIWAAGHRCREMHRVEGRVMQVVLCCSRSQPSWQAAGDNWASMISWALAGTESGMGPESDRTLGDSLICLCGRSIALSSFSRCEVAKVSKLSHGFFYQGLDLGSAAVPGFGLSRAYTARTTEMKSIKVSSLF
jgi:hypothetical protein